jgi:hypothetical protein
MDYDAFKEHGPAWQAVLPSNTESEREAVGQTLQFVLNCPARCDAFLYSIKDDACHVVRSTLDLDEKSFWSCFYCGAPPFSSGITLSTCSGCRRVAYCGKECQVYDWDAMHSKEC